MTYSWRFSAATDIGRTRKKNDDSGYAGPHLLMVADGMGGAAAGDLASAVAVQTMQRLDAPPPKDLLEALAGALYRANDRLSELIDEDPAVEGMGTTVTAALFDGERIGVAHLGDSRGYLWHEGELLRITSDHTWVQSLIDEGRITEDEAKVHSHRSLLLKVLDGRNDHDPDLTLYDVQPGDRILLCSDGLSGFVEHDRIERVLSIGTPDSAAKELTQLALEAGSTDNVTVVVADIIDEPSPSAEPVVVGAAAEEPPGGPNRRRGRPPRETAVTAGSSIPEGDADPEELRYAPRAPRRFVKLRRLAVVLVLLVVATATAIGAYRWSQQQYYVAANGEQVAIYQGVQGDLPGIQLHHVYEMQDLRLSELPSFRRSQVLEGITADDLDHAHRIVDKLVTFADTCAQQASETATTVTAPTATLTTPRSTGGAVPSETAPRTPAETTSTASTTGPGAPKECAGASPATRTPR